MRALGRSFLLEIVLDLDWKEPLVEPGSNWLFVCVLPGQDLERRWNVHFFDEPLSVELLLLVEDLLSENELFVFW